MSEGAGGTSVGKIYVDVGLRLSPEDAANFNRQIGAAVGSGGVGGGGGAVATGAGGGGYSPNMGSASLSAKLTAERSAAGLRGQTFGGDLGSLGGIANTAQRQAQFVHEQFPFTTFDYRMQSVTSNAQRRVVAFDQRQAERAEGELNRNESRFTMAADRAALQSQRMTERTNAAQAQGYRGEFYDYYNAARSGTPMSGVARAMSAAQGPAANDTGYWQRAQWSGADWDSAMQGIAGPGKGPGFFSRLNNSRFFGAPSGRRLSMQLTFGGVESARAYNAYSNAGYTAETRGAAEGMRAYRGAASQIAGGFFGAIAGAAVEGAEAMGLFHGGFRATDDAIYEAEQSKLDDEGRAKSQITARQFRRQARNMRFQAGQYGPTGAYNRAIRAASGRTLEAQGEYEDLVEDYGTKMRFATTQKERTRIARELGEVSRAAYEKRQAAAAVENADVGELKRVENIDIGGERRQSAALGAAASGQFGVADRIDFQNKLKESLEEAKEKHSHAYANLVGINNQTRMAGYEARLFASGRQMGFAGDAARAQLVGSGWGVLDAQRRSALDAVGQLDPSVQADARYKADMEGALRASSYSEQLSQRRFAIRDQAAIARAAANTSYTQRGAGFSAQAESIYLEARAKMRELTDQPDFTTEEYRGLAGAGADRLRSFRRSITEATHGEAISGPLGVGGGNSEVVRLLKEISDKIGTLSGLATAG